MFRSILPASGLAALGLAWLVSALVLRSRRLSLAERMRHCADELQLRVYA